MIDAFFGAFSRDIGMDLGTANTLVHVRGRGIVISEPSIVAVDSKTRKVLEIGAEAKRMLGRTPSTITIVRPLRDGVVSDFDVTEQMIKYFVQRVHDRVGLVPRPRMLLGIPSGVTEVEDVWHKLQIEVRDPGIFYHIDGVNVTNGNLIEHLHGRDKDKWTGKAIDLRIAEITSGQHSGDKCIRIDAPGAKLPSQCPRFKYID